MRYGDQTGVTRAAADFIPRARGKDIWRIIIGFVIAVVLMLFLNMMPNTVGGATEASLISLLIISFLCFYIVYQKQQNLDLVMNTEFQNMLFAQAAAHGSDFCLFVKRDGVIVYANDGLRKLFPEINYADANILSGFFEIAEINMVDRERVMDAIYNNQRDRLIFPLRNRDGGHKEYMLMLDPINRPAGYMVLRGREYYNKRVGSSAFPQMLRATSPDHIEHLLSFTPAPLFITDEHGTISYATPALEALLGYEQGEINRGKMRLHNLLQKIGNEVVTEEFRLHDAQSDASALHKNGQSNLVLLSLFTMRDNDGKIIGATGTLVPTN